jgi:NAD(P)-dependent dehydrogenase (short-subunit alcohol dehydrogenase family)
VNAYSQFFLALELLPLLRATAAVRGAPTRLTFTSSAQYKRHSLTRKPLKADETVFGHFDNQQKFSNLTRYPDSKLVVVAFVRELASRVSASEVIVNEFCPGLVQTNLDHELPTPMKYLAVGVRKIAARNVQEGARTLIYASGIVGPDSHGRHLQDNKVQK